MSEEKKYDLPHTQELQHPITLSNKEGAVVREVTELVFRNPVTAAMVKHLPAGSGITMGHMLPILGKMTGEPDTVIDRLQWDDLQEAMAVLGSFLGSGPATGANT